ncbi:bifunctional diaminohydroxyphosphoribosylaminopyrimidine deaminase/5-amino-6-(5-phosphoribosylamino)uracil reductase RibD [Neomoorella thermoacetica]|uniref:Riboflavin biosynthesis protein RibD n=2 Tax=Neomoorella thermoacetica TaxID=1525 RepID=A0A1D7X9S3_NEOTH|nr:bifunctional diaminohydroxyphosphoribosylaminopyrimidine deaminase/5-amino-6-(5-phosphoribosylamino)uracil reductase RibD [Moorella thermoacetica]AKX93670.1 riboflavin biosynthesis protein RibD [Moorella thermoacetica]AKX96312.1 riboflavin biosynthesis protein RibD [Moorella thermoacetica]AOQ23581.1 Riboflavin biosynthesis protein RibD [Moorella thermoacetica]OIQ09680.1 riboflavin biosynthesis protein RibD [Moorella thermoacetica]OIQ11279.1 riboflavin biosynthesis protein RibD [Moorella the
MQPQDAIFMARALELARQGLGRTSPNPTVGAVIVRDGQVVGEGYHQKAGTPHAEIHALRAAGEKARGATLYVTLEPCCHYGRTPPCTEAIIAAGIKRVVAAMADPNPRVAGGGFRALSQAGIEVETGLLADEARRLNEAFIKYITTGRPWVTLKMALTLDGKIATRTGAARWITGPAARQRAHELRDIHDAILVGIGTVLADDPELTTRLPDGRGRDAIRVILDSHLRLPLSARVVNLQSEAPTLVVTTPSAPAAARENLAARGVEVLVLPEEDGRVAWQPLLAELARRQVTSILVEGGAEVNATALAAGIVDKVVAFIAPKIFGGREAPAPVGGLGVADPATAWKLEKLAVERCGEDIMLSGYLLKRGEEPCLPG